ncbi:MAG TPA: tetratricopeptide repeat protein [Chitinophagaceae bacterium]|jgi:signal transduction histidine kinase/tetratricopeptide (TPR) repeat protein|nr:tetratricopeptide repeat protein [Chitinophagaceae bacterium]
MGNDTVIASLHEKIDDLNQQAWKVRVTDLPKSFELSQESVKLARGINYPKGLAEGLRSLGFSYVRFSKNEEAVPLLKESLSLFQSLNDLKGQAVVYEYLGIIERNWGNLGASLDLLLKANEMVLQTGPPEVEITSCYQLGVTYKHLGNHENALDYLYKTLSLAKKINFPLMEAYATNIIGSIYFDNGNYIQALNCYQQGLPVRQQSHDKWGEAGSLDNIGFTYLKLNDLDKAIEYCKQSLAICQGTGDKKGEANALLHLGEIYEKAGDIKQAAGFSNKSLEIRKARGDKRGETEVLLFLADLFKNRNDVEDQQIFEWLSDALKIADEIKAQDLVSKAYYNLHEYYQQKGNFKESLVQLEAHFQIEKELHKNSINQKVANLEISHKAEVVSQRNKELTELNERIEKANEELRIERSLERVRTAAMAMNEPADMLEVCKIISDQLEILDVKKIRNIQTAIFYEEKSVYMNYEYYAKHDKKLITEVDYSNHPVAEKFANQMLKGPNEVFTHGFTGEEVRDWLDYQKTTNVFIDTYLETANSLNYYWYSLGPVALGMSTYVPLTENEIDLFKRFRNVFELAYRRYLDIEKAEAQVREAQIEAALERVRSKTMAMQRSEELDSVIKTVYSELKHLDVSFDRCFIMIFNEQKGATWWMASPEDDLFHEGFYVPYHTHPPHLAYLKGWEERQQKWEYWLGGQIKKDWDEFLFYKTGLSKLPPIAIQYMKSFDAAHLAASFENFGCMTTGGQERLSEGSFSILSRFAKVFDQTYTRFNDLKHAEAQAREAKIEAALERVRAKAMAMHKSDDLKPAVATVFEELDKLNLGLIRCGIAILDKEKPRGDIWITIKSDHGNTIEVSGDESLDIHPLLRGAYDAWLKLEDFSYVLHNDDLARYYQAITKTNFQQPVSATFTTEKKDHQQYYFNAVFQDGSLFAFLDTAFTDEAKMVMKRFANVFNLTYKRFLDLQNAEAQARAAKIEAALERVRARALAMQEPEELKEVAQVLRTEMGLLGVEELETCSIYINDGSAEKAECWYALKDITSEQKKLVNDHFALDLNDTWVGKQMLQFYRSSKKQVSIVMQGENRKEWIGYCEERSAPLRGYYGEVIPDRTYHLYKFSHGAIGAAAAGEISEESWRMLNRAASVFSLAYSRFKDLTQARTDLIKLKEEKKRAEDALRELQATQKQLIQSEKMASLGELTAGIAHEIQNPLNFVNNFSDVSNELLEEMKTELEKGNAKEAKAIAIDVKQNLEKILHHGRRADAIVKGMLQHSRSSGGQKELTDINTLAEEYLRLAYHGLRAKDKFFNAKFETDLDPSITKINIVPQEIGRVILNLINNSFYAVSEKKKAAPPPEGGIMYEPVVTVTTKRLGSSSGDGGKIEIRVKDNGIGIPKKALDKIFQPFFTTKPTGQGTGLGLSLSYDIVTQGHDGEIKVETKEGEGAEFTITLPMN